MMGIAYSAIDTYLFRGKAPWTLHNHPDHTQLRKASDMPKIQYPKPDGVITFDRLSSVFMSDTNHEENQPAHLTLKNKDVPVATNLALYDGPEPDIARPAFTKSSGRPMAARGCRSMPRIACIAKRAISRTRPRT